MVGFLKTRSLKKGDKSKMKTNNIKRIISVFLVVILMVGFVNTNMYSPVKVKAAENVAGARINETDYNVRRNTNFYNDDSWTADWE